MTKIHDATVFRHWTTGRHKTVVFKRRETSKVQRGHTAPFHENRCLSQEFCEFWLPYPLLTWLSQLYCVKTSQQGMASSPFHSKNSNADQSCRCNEEIKEPEFFSKADLRPQLSSFHKWKILNLPSVPKIQAHKNSFPCSFWAVYKIHPGHTAPFYE